MTLTHDLTGKLEYRKCGGLARPLEEMTMALSEQDSAFLDRTRIGVLISAAPGQAPRGVPVWFDWDGNRVSLFSARDAAKVRRLRANPQASLLVANQVGEAEHWVAFDGDVSVRDGGGLELAERLAARYWDLNDPDKAATLNLWREHAATLCRLVLTPSRIRSGS